MRQAHTVVYIASSQINNLREWKWEIYGNVTIYAFTNWHTKQFSDRESWAYYAGYRASQLIHLQAIKMQREYDTQWGQYRHFNMASTESRINTAYYIADLEGIQFSGTWFGQRAYCFYTWGNGHKVSVRV